MGSAWTHPELSPVAAPLPLARAGAFALVSVAFALIAHSTTSHTLPSLWLVGCSVVVVAATAHPMAALEHRLPSLVTGLVATQLILHAVFQLQATGRSSVTTAGWLCCGSDATPLPMSTTATPAHTDGPFGRAALVQLGVHVLVALVIATALRLRERSVWTLARQAAARAGATLGRLLGTLIATVAAVLPVSGDLSARRAQPRRAGPSPMRNVLIDARAPRRGPPATPVFGRAPRLA